MTDHSEGKSVRSIVSRAVNLLQDGELTPDEVAHVMRQDMREIMPSEETISAVITVTDVDNCKNPHEWCLALAKSIRKLIIERLK